MALAVTNSALRMLRGRVGDLVYKHYGDKLVVTKVPVFRQPATHKQRGRRNRFAEASRYATKVLRTPELAALYAPIAKARRINIYNAALSDHLVPIEIQRVEFTGWLRPRPECVQVTVKNRYKVVAIDVMIRDGARGVVASGAAEGKAHSWSFAAKELPADELLTVELAARDRVGRTTIFRFHGRASEQGPLVRVDAVSSRSAR